MRFAIFFFMALFSVIVPVLLGNILASSYESRLWNQKVASVESQSVLDADRISTSGFQFNEMNQTLATEVQQFASLIEGRIMVVDQNYRIVKDTFGIETDRYLITTDVLKTMAGQPYVAKKLNDQYLEIIYPIKSMSEEKVIGVLCVISSYQDLNDTSVYMRTKKNSLVLLFAAVFLILSYAASMMLTKKFKEFNKNVHYIADGHTDEKLDVIGYTEMQETARTFNEIFEKMQKLEASRQEFVSNVSHELKTPITSIKVLAESLLMMPDAEAALYREFMEDIVAEIDRENTIINDLLSLVKMDKKVAALNFETVNINELIESIVKRLRPIAGKREIEITFDQLRPVTAEIDSVKLTLAMSNLIENAIKYNRDNGWVRVTLNADHKYFYFKVEDSGEGISEEHQEHIFERFYRVDKARSRETGGTGLGLAITREVILLHKGAVKVHSIPEEGTTFTVRIPLTKNS